MSAKCNLLVVVAIPAIAAIPLFACGSDNKNSPDASGGGMDAPGSGSGSGSNHALCALPASLGTITSFTAQSIRYRSGSGFGSGSGSGSGSAHLPRANRLTLTGALDGSATQEIQITIYGGCGSTGSNCSGTVPVTPDWPGLFGAKSGVDMYAAPDVSAIAAAGVGSNGQPSALYELMAGTLNVTMAGNGSGAPFAGTATGMTFVHVDFGSGGVMADPDGCMTTVTSLTFSGSAAFNGKTVVLEDLDPDDNGITYLHHRYY